MIKKQLETEKDLNVTQEVRGLAARPASARLLEAARQTPQEVFAAYETTPQGQPRPDIMRALFGRNELARKKADSILKRLFKAFINPFTVVLIVLAVISCTNRSVPLMKTMMPTMRTAVRSRSSGSTMT